jgi:uncharacterized protein DUF5926/SEC-C motif-containing protein
MAKRAAARASTAGQPNPRQACPCGSGKRYKACHGAAGGAPETIVTRPFEGLAGECDLIALREFVPSATAALPLAGEPGREVTLATVLPMVWAAMVREDGSALVGMQVQTSSVDLSRDLARAIEWALTAKPGAALPALGPDNDAGTSRLQDVLRAGEPLAVTLYKDFAWWVPEDEKPSGEVELSLERANSVILPTERIDAPGVEAAYWSVFRGGKAHLRWVRPEPEEQLLVALARLGAGGGLDLGEGSRYAGSLRAHGLLVPVWDLDVDRHAREWYEPAALFATRLSEALASDAPLTDTERRTLQGLRARQLTLR